MFYKVESLHITRGNSNWVGWRKVHTDHESAFAECTRLRLGHPQWTFRIIKCEVLDD